MGKGPEMKRRTHERKECRTLLRSPQITHAQNGTSWYNREKIPMAFPAILHGLSSLLIECAKAAPFESFEVSTWAYGDVTWESIVGSIGEMLTATIEIASMAVFVTGGFFFAISAGDENRKSKGKNMMIYSLVALGIVVGAKGIMRTISYFIWG
jgi:hypothetical protein